MLSFSVMGRLFTQQQLQYPVLETSLAEARSLWDPIVYRGWTTEFNANVLQLESACSKFYFNRPMEFTHPKTLYSHLTILHFPSVAQAAMNRHDF
jgi:hypothetical protein